MRAMITRRLTKRVLLPLVLVLSISCGGGTLLRSFRVALASSGPLVSSLAASGAIPNGKMSAIITDFDAGAQCGLTLQNQFSAIPSTLSVSEQRSRKLQASQSALQCFRAIINHQNFAVNSRIQTVANIAEGILASLVAFYSESSGDPTSAVAGLSEDEFEKRLSKRVDELKAAMKP